MKTEIIIIIILSILLLGAILFYGYNYTYAKAYNQGRANLIIEMNQNSYFPVLVQQNNQTIIKNTALNQICGSAG